MHKQEAAHLFTILGDEDIVKTLKLLYNLGDLSLNDLSLRIEASDLDAKLELLIKENLISLINEKYHANRELIDELMSFITTACKCMRS